MKTIVESRFFKQHCYINGQWVTAASEKSDDWIEVDDPATGGIIGRVPKFGAEQTDKAIVSAEQALPLWREKTADERALILRRWGELMLQHQQELASIMTLEQGKPLAEACGEISYAASFFQWFSEEARRAYGETIPAAKSGQHIVTLKQGVGVCAAITPWNFPASMITRKTAAALAAGCTLIVKPASSTPFSALALAVLAAEAEVPAGVFNVITGSAAAISETLTKSPLVRKISFTGSTSVGSQLMASAATHIQKISLELGGNAPFIVFDDADIDRAVEGAMAAKFRNTGQTCVCVNRFLVHSSVTEVFTQKLATAMAALKLGNGFEAGVTQSALINRAAVDKVVEHIDDAVQKGGRIILGGAKIGARTGESAGSDNFIAPTLIADGHQDMQVCKEETFGPLAVIIPFETEAEAIVAANNTPFGLAAYFYSDNIHRCWRVAGQLEAGMVGINEGIISNAAAPFGGVKASGLGREGGRAGLDEYMEIKYLCFG